jgi:enediyne biosynthesis protein E4
MNNKDGTFRDISFSSGVAASEDGKYEAGMGTDAADIDHDGWLDIYVTHLDFELDRLYHNNHDETFDDYTWPSGIGNKAIFLSGVTSKLMDYDNDGWVDIVQSNGSMLDNIKMYHKEVDYLEPKLMYRNLGKGKFEKVSEHLGPDFMRPTAGRGLAAADYDNDGDMDFAVLNRGDYPQVLRNDGGNANNWLEVKLIGTQSARDGTGAHLKLVSEGVTYVEQSKGGIGYMSAHDQRIHFGLGKRKSIESLEITWLSGTVDKLTNVPINQIITVREGAGIVPGNFPKIPGK